MKPADGQGENDEALLECVINVSEGRDDLVLAVLAEAGGPRLLDLHRDADHHRAVLTLAGERSSTEAAVRAVATAAVDHIDLRRHAGVHPRIGALDVVPFVALARPAGTAASGRERDGTLRPGRLADAVAARDGFATWAGETLDLPCFPYGPERSLPEVRRLAWHGLAPTTGPGQPHPSAGACAVGARGALVAYNLWLDGADADAARRIAAELRGPSVRALGLDIGAGQAQVSCNLIDPWRVGPAAVFDAVANRAAVHRAELVGLLPRAVLDGVPPASWARLGLSPDATIEARLDRPPPEGPPAGPH